METKLTPSLQQLLRSKPGLVHLAIDIEAPPSDLEESMSPNERMEQMIRRFDKLCGPAVRRIEGLGGKVETMGWSNSTLYAVLPDEAVNLLETVDRVSRIDVAGTVSQPVFRDSSDQRGGRLGEERPEPDPAT